MSHANGINCYSYNYQYTLAKLQKLAFAVYVKIFMALISNSIFNIHGYIWLGIKHAAKLHDVNDWFMAVVMYACVLLLDSTVNGCALYSRTLRTKVYITGLFND